MKSLRFYFGNFLLLSFLFLVLQLFFIGSALALEESFEQNLETIDKVLPVDSECSVGFAYTYRPAKSSTAATVVFFGGGPSAPTVGRDSFPIPPEFGLLSFDYPGVGKNSELFSCGDWSAERIAKMVLGVLRSLSLDNYVIYGISYGTVPATIATALVEKTPSLLRPKVLLLESVVARAYKPGEVIVSFQKQWRQVLKNLPDGVVRSLATISGSSNSECTPESWGAWIEQALSIGAGPGHRHLAEELLLAISAANTKLGFCAPDVKNELPEITKKAYRALVCREINSTAPDHTSSFRLAQLSLRPRAGNACSGIEMDRAYDSANWKIVKTPIAYFIGGRDPATPVEHAYYHIEQHSESSRVVLEVPQAGHNPLSVSLADCAQDLFRAYLVSSNAVQRIRLSKCSQKSLFRIIRP